ncbi:MAG TPA: N-formylglutamate amidohydrolase [Rubrivivax sp.]|nr:N-formylglutamate amidohydrolase [Rubrivivax sp.]
MSSNPIHIHGPLQAQLPLVLDSPHSGFEMPADFGSCRSHFELRDGEDCFIDEMWLPSAGAVPLLVANFPRTYLDPNRHAGDIDLQLLDEPWPGDWVPSGKARIGKALLWRTMDDGRPIYDRKLSVAEVQRRIERYHRPYHEALVRLLDATHARFGVVLHINCHSMNPVGGVMGETATGRRGEPRADIVLGDRDGSSCAPRWTGFVRDFFVGCGYDVKINDPFKGVELVRAYSNPAAGRHSLQIEVNKRLYMDGATLRKTPGFALLQTQLVQLVDTLGTELRKQSGAKP